MKRISEKEPAARREFYPEITGIILSAIGILLLCTSLENMIKQAVCVIIGLVVFHILSGLMHNEKLLTFMCVASFFGGIALLAANIIVGISAYGAQNWLTVKGVTFQPSEFVKVCMVIQAVSLRDDTSNKRFWVFTAFSAICVLSMAVINDFGSALIFFIAFLAAAMEHNRFKPAGLALVSATGVGALAVKLKPHIAARFLSCGKAWENAATTGYQQTRTMVATASGGLFGVGLGSGWLRNVVAADTDMVFGIVCEELGLVVGLVCVALILFLGIGVLLRKSSCGAVTAAIILMLQMALNVLGSVDIIPFTGVTFPFLSRGGTSIIACWGLLAVIKGDTNA